jgi:hypothetical protein
MVDVGADFLGGGQLDDRNLQPLTGVAKVQPVVKRLVGVQNDVQQAARLGFGIDFIQWL